MIAILDYGIGNLGAILNMLRRIGAEAVICSKREDLEKAEKLILPGVGAFDNGMKTLNDLGLVQVLNHKALVEKIPVLGICLGAQLISKNSEEGSLPGLGWIDVETVRFDFGKDQNGLKVPHMGWNTIKLKKPSYLFNEMYEETRFYFVHSYHFLCNDPDDILTLTLHGYEFVSSFHRDNIIGVQFHPEKSHKFGLKLLSNFAEFSTNA